MNLGRKGKNENYWNLSFGKRDQETLYDLKKDPDCIKNIAKFDKYKSKMIVLKFLTEDLTKNKDPRITGEETYLTIIYMQKKEPETFISVL